MKTKCLIGSIILAPIIVLLAIGFGTGVAYCISLIPYDGPETFLILVLILLSFMIGACLYNHCIERKERKKQCTSL